MVEILFDPEVNEATKKVVPKLLDKKLTNVLKINYRNALMEASKDLVRISCPGTKPFSDFEHSLQSFDDQRDFACFCLCCYRPTRFDGAFSRGLLSEGDAGVRHIKQ